MAAFLVSHSAPDALRKKRKLVFRWLFARPSNQVGLPVNLRTSFTNELLFCFRPRVSHRSSTFNVASVSSQPRGLFRRNVTLITPTFRWLDHAAIRNEMGEEMLEIRAYSIRS